MEHSSKCTSCKCAGTWKTQDGGLTWNPVSSQVYQGDRMVKVDSITMLSVGSTVYKYELGPNGISEPQTNNDEISHSLIVYPNPAKELMTIDAIAVTNTFGLIDILDEKGIRIMQVTRQAFPKGKNSFSVNLRKLTAGTYKVVWHSNEKMVVRSFTMVR